MNYARTSPLYQTNLSLDMCLSLGWIIEIRTSLPFNKQIEKKKLLLNVMMKKKNTWVWN